MRQTHDQIAADIRRLFETLAPYGIRRPSQLAALMREDSDAWPSDAYIRLMLSAKGPDPSERFCDRFHALADHVYAALAGGEDVLPLVTAALDAPDTYDPAERIHFIAVPPAADLHAGLLVLAANGPARLAVIPDGVLGHCEDDECGRPFIRRVPWQRYCCDAHGRAWRRRQAATVETQEARRSA